MVGFPSCFVKPPMLGLLNLKEEIHGMSKSEKLSSLVSSYMKNKVTALHSHRVVVLFLHAFSFGGVILQSADLKARSLYHSISIKVNHPWRYLTGCDLKRAFLFILGRPYTFEVGGSTKWRLGCTHNSELLGLWHWEMVDLLRFREIYCFLSSLAHIWYP